MVQLPPSLPDDALPDWYHDPPTWRAVGLEVSHSEPSTETEYESSAKYVTEPTPSTEERCQTTGVEAARANGRDNREATRILQGNLPQGTAAGVDLEVYKGWEVA